MSAPDLPLADRVILLTRPAGDGRALAERLSRLGARVDCRPTIRLEPAGDPTGAREAVKELDSFEWVVFTSVNGVRFFLETRREVGQGGPVAARIVGRQIDSAAKIVLRRDRIARSQVPNEGLL